GAGRRTAEAARRDSVGFADGVFRYEQRRDPVARNLGFRIPEQFLEGGIDQLHPLLVVEHDDPGRAVPNQAPEHRVVLAKLRTERRRRLFIRGHATTRVPENRAGTRLQCPVPGGLAVKVLVADDDRIAATVLSQTLRQWEFDVTVVPDGA